MNSHPTQPEQRGGGRLGAMTDWFAIAGGCVMLAVAILVTISVGLRYWLGDGIRGDFEMVQIATAVAVFAFLPLCAWRRGNIFVDALTIWLPRPVQRALDALWDAVYGAAALIIAWQLLRGARETISSGTVSLVLHVPTGWVIAVCGVMAILLAGAAFAVAFRLVHGASR